MKNLTDTADRIAARYIKSPPFYGVDLRDYVDGLTGGELDYQPLNILTDMVQKRIKAVAA